MSIAAVWSARRATQDEACSTREGRPAGAVPGIAGRAVPIALAVVAALAILAFPDLAAAANTPEWADPSKRKLEEAETGVLIVVGSAFVLMLVGAAIFGYFKQGVMGAVKGAGGVVVLAFIIGIASLAVSWAVAVGT